MLHFTNILSPMHFTIFLHGSLGQSGNCQSGSEWHHTLAHWHLPLWPQVAIVIGAQSGCHMVIYYFFYFLYKNEMIRWFPCGIWRHSGSFIGKMVWGGIAGFIFPFFFFLSLLTKLFLDGSTWLLLFLAPLC